VRHANNAKAILFMIEPSPISMQETIQGRHLSCNSRRPPKGTGEQSEERVSLRYIVVVPLVFLFLLTFALALNISTVLIRKWERGEVHPSGPSLKLLSLARRASTLFCEAAPHEGLILDVFP
jgi:hypothetical protein